MTSEIELDLNDSTPAKKSKVTKPTLAETLYAQRLANGLQDIPDEDDPTFSNGTKVALAEIQHHAAGPLQVETTSALIAEGLKEFGIDSDLTAEELFDLATHAFSNALFQTVKAGVAYMAAQEAIKSASAPGALDTFSAWMQSHGLAKERVYEAMRLAKGYLAIPADQRKSYISLGKKKALKLASLDPETLADLAEKDPELIDGLSLLSRADLAKRIKNLQTEIERQSDRADAAEKRRGRDPSIVFPAATQMVRDDCLVYQANVELSVNSIQALFEETANDDASSPDWQMRMEQVWVTANVVAARTTMLLAAIKDLSPVELPSQITTKNALTDDEAVQWAFDYQMIERKYVTDKAIRDTKRINETPGKRGRKIGSTNKAAK